jgi:hypothetical protein
MVAAAQSPRDGHVENGAYLSSYFKVSYAWPKILQAYDTSALHLPQAAANGNEFLLFSAREGDQPFGVVIIAEKPNFHKARPDGLNESEALLEHVKKIWDPAGHPKVIAQTQVTNSDNLTFYELDYLIFNEYSSAITTPIGEYQLVFRCNANSLSDLKEMTKSVLATHRLK